MPANTANHWKTLLAGTVGVAAALVPGVAQAQQQVAQASGPVTSISQLSDVQPTDWAFQALQSLVERYGCIAGYPDRTYRGNRAMTRFEFAAGMNACLDRINELIAAGLADKVSKEDLATLQRLQEEFAAELAALKGRVDTLEADVKDLQKKVFNPVTKLNVQLFAAITGSALDGDAIIEAPNGDRQLAVNSNGVPIGDQDAANMTFPYRLRMNFDASFVGKDRLRIRLQAREANTRFFAGDPRITFGGGGASNTFILDTLSYRFKAFNDTTTIAVGIQGVDVDERFQYSSPFTGMSEIADDSPVGSVATDNGTAAVAFNTKFSENFTFAYGYAVEDATTVGTFGGPGGVTGGNSTHALEVGYQADTFGLYFQFGSAYIEDGDVTVLQRGGSSNLRYVDSTGEITSTGRQLFRGALGDAEAYARVNGYTVAGEWEITPRVIFSGWYSWLDIDYTLRPGAPAGSVDPGSEDGTAWLAGFLFPDLFLEGAEGGIVFGQLPFSDDSGLPDQPFLLDLYYSFPVNDYITITPGAYFVFNPNGGSGINPDGSVLVDDPTIGVGAIRAEFSF